MADLPRIFISTVTRELKSTRQRVADILRRKGFEPECQDIFGTEHGDLRDMLRRKIEGCAGLIQIIGVAYGAEPSDPATGAPLPDAQFGRCSYTQYEFLLARSLGKKTWLLIADGICARDTVPALLDLPLDSAHPDPAAWQAERRLLQRDYRQRPEVRQHLYYTAESDLALDLQVERMGDKLEELRKGFHRWQRTVLRLAAAVILLAGIILGTQWWMKREADKGTGRIIAGQKEIAEGQKAIIEGPKITTAGIRKQILLGSERKRDRDLAEADAAEPAKREKLREAALAAHTSRISRLDELAQSFTELEGRADTTAVFKEMARILEQEGVDMALAYIAEQKGGILDRVRKRKEIEQAQTRTELQPLLTAADLKGSSGQTVAARAAFRELLALDPAWPAALDSAAWFLWNQSVQNNAHGTLIAALADAEEAHTLATRLHAAAPTSSTAQRLFSTTHNQMGDVLIKRSQDGDTAKVEAHFTRSLELAEALLKANPGSAQATRDVSISLDRLGEFLARRGQVGDAVKALGYFTRSLELAEALLKANPGSAQATRDVSVSLNKLGYFLEERG
jgi:phage tail protein X